MSTAVELAVRAQTKSFEDGFRRMNVNSERLNKTLSDMSRNTIRSLNDGMTRMNRTLGAAARDTKKLEQANDALRKKMSAMQAATGKGTSGLKGMTGALRGGVAGLAKFAGGVGLVVAGVAALGYATFRTIRALSRFSEDFRKMESAIAKTGVLIDASTSALRRMRSEVSEMSNEVGRSTQDLAAGFFDIVSAGNEAADAMIILRQAGKLATGGFAETKDTADILTAAINAYNLSARDAERVSDVLFQTQKLGKTTISELSQSLGSLLPIAAATGTSLEDMGAALSTLTGGRAGTGRTVQAVTTLRTLLNSILRPSKQATKLANELELEWNSTALAAKGFAGFIQDLQKRFESTDESVRITASDLAVLSGRIRGMTAALSLVGKQSKDFNEDVEKMGESAGTTEKAFESMRDTSLQVWDEAKNAWVEFKEAMGQGIVTVLRPAMEELTELLVGLAKRIRDAANAWDELKDKAKDAPTSVADSVLEYVDDARDQHRAAQIYNARQDKRKAQNLIEHGPDNIIERLVDQAGQGFQTGGRGYRAADLVQATGERRRIEMGSSFGSSSPYSMNETGMTAGVASAEAARAARKAERLEAEQLVRDQQALQRDIRLDDMKDAFKAQRKTLDHQLAMDQIGATEYVKMRHKAISDALAFAREGIDENGEYTRQEQAVLTAFALEEGRKVLEAGKKNEDELADAAAQRIKDAALAQQRALRGASTDVGNKRTDLNFEVGMGNMTELESLAALQTYIETRHEGIKGAEEQERRLIQAVLLARKQLVDQQIKDDQKAEQDRLRSLNKISKEQFATAKGWSDHEVAMERMTSQEQLKFLEENFATELAGNTEIAAKIIALRREIAEAGFDADKEAIDKRLKYEMEAARKLAVAQETERRRLAGISRDVTRGAAQIREFGGSQGSLHTLGMQLRQGDRMGLDMQGSQFSGMGNLDLANLSQEDANKLRKAIEDNTNAIKENSNEYKLQTAFQGMSGSPNRLIAAAGATGVSALNIRTALQDDSMSGTDKIGAIGDSLQSLGSAIGGKAGGAVSGAGRVASGAAQGAMIGSVVPGIGTVAGGIIGGGLSLGAELFSAFDDTDEALENMISNIEGSFTSLGQILSDSIAQGLTGAETQGAIDKFIRTMVFSMATAKIVEKAMEDDLNAVGEAFRNRNEQGGIARLNAAIEGAVTTAAALQPELLTLGSDLGAIGPLSLRQQETREAFQIEQNRQNEFSRLRSSDEIRELGREASRGIGEALGFVGQNPRRASEDIQAQMRSGGNRVMDVAAQDALDLRISSGAFDPTQGVRKAAGRDAIPLMTNPLTGMPIPAHLGTGGDPLNYGNVQALQDAQVRQQTFDQQTALADSTAGKTIDEQLEDRAEAAAATTTGRNRPAGFQVSTISGAMRDAMRNNTDQIVNVLEDIRELLGGSPTSASTGSGAGAAVAVEGDLILQVTGDVADVPALVAAIEVALGQELRLNAGQIGG